MWLDMALQKGGPGKLRRINVKEARLEVRTVAGGWGGVRLSISGAKSTGLLLTIWGDGVC